MLKEITRFKTTDNVNNIYTIIVYVDHIESTNHDKNELMF